MANVGCWTQSLNFFHYQTQEALLNKIIVGVTEMVDVNSQEVAISVILSMATSTLYRNGLFELEVSQAINYNQ